MCSEQHVSQRNHLFDINVCKAPSALMSYGGFKISELPFV